MDNNIQKLLEQNIRLTKENNHLLRSMRRAAIYGFIGKILFWIIMLGVPAYLYVSYISPILFGNQSQRTSAWERLVNTSNISTQTIQSAFMKISTYSKATKK